MTVSSKYATLTRVHNFTSVAAQFTVILLGSVTVMAQSPISSQTPEDLERGRRLFERQCARCHGMSGAGGTGPALTSPVLKPRS